MESFFAGKASSSDHEGEVRRLIDYTGVPFDPACFDLHNNRPAIHTPSAEQVRRPINRDGVDYGDIMSLGSARLVKLWGRRSRAGNASVAGRGVPASVQCSWTGDLRAMRSPGKEGGRPPSVQHQHCQADDFRRAVEAAKRASWLWARFTGHRRSLSPCRLRRSGGGRRDESDEVFLDCLAATDYGVG